MLRYAADIYTDNLLLMAKSINPQAPTLFKAKLSPHSKSFSKHAHRQTSQHHEQTKSSSPLHPLATLPHKLEWSLSSQLLIGIRFAETRLSDLICQNDVQVLEFSGFGKRWITQFGQFSPDAFVQMAFLAGYYGLYGRIECMYEPAMTKTFYHGRTEAIRSVQPESVNFVKVCKTLSSELDMTFTARAQVDILLRCLHSRQDQGPPHRLRSTCQDHQGMQQRTRSR